MKVCLNASTQQGVRTGVGWYTQQISLHTMRDSRVQLLPFTAMQYQLKRFRQRMNRDDNPQPRSEIQPAPALPNWRLKLRSFSKWLSEAHFRQFIRWHRPDVYHEPNYVPLEFDGPTVTSVHDITPITNPEWHPSDRVAWFEANFLKRLERCSCCLVPSEYTQREIMKLGILKPEQIHLVPLAARPSFQKIDEARVQEVRERLQLPGEFLLFVGTIEPRKNIKTLIEAFLELPLSLQQRCPLVLAGRWGWNGDDLLDLLNSNTSAIRWLGYVPEDDLLALVNGALAMVYPSLCEGFGLPPLEAMECGCPVIASNQTSIPEVVGDAAILVDPNDTNSLRQAMSDVILEAELREELSEKGTRQAKFFSWKNTARKTVDAYYWAHRNAA